MLKKKHEKVYNFSVAVKKELKELVKKKKKLNKKIDATK